MKTLQKLPLYANILMKKRNIAMIDSLLAMIDLSMFDYDFMRRAIIAIIALSVILPPLGLFMIARRMSLMGDAISHALLPGIVIAALFFGTSFIALTLGALFSGIIIAILTTLLLKTGVKEDASFAAMTVISLSLGVAFLPLTQGGLELTHLLFGSILTLNDETLILLIGTSLSVAVIFSLTYRALVIDTVDPAFKKFKAVSLLFLTLTLVSLVASFQAIGTLLAVGMMLLPALIAKVWAKYLPMQIALSIIVSLVAGFIGLALSFYANLTPSPAIMLSHGVIYIVSLLIKAALNLKSTPHLKG
jgi:zinc/manganese transport system permease protein